MYYYTINNSWTRHAGSVKSVLRLAAVVRSIAQLPKNMDLATRVRRRKVPPRIFPPNGAKYCGRSVSLNVDVT